MTLRLTDGKLTTVAFDSVDGSDTKLTLSVHDKVTRALLDWSRAVYNLIYNNPSAIASSNGN